MSQVCAELAGVAGNRCDAAESGAPVGRAEDGRVAAGGGKELGTEDGAESLVADRAC